MTRPVMLTFVGVEGDDYSNEWYPAVALDGKVIWQGRNAEMMEDYAEQAASDTFASALANLLSIRDPTRPDRFPHEHIVNPPWKRGRNG